VPLSSGDREVKLVLFDLDDVLVPFLTPRAWQWAWRPQGPILGERRVRAAVRRSLRVWDRRRWLGLTGKAPAADLAALRRHLAETLWEVAGHPLPPEETEAVVRRLLHPSGELETYGDVAGGLRRLRELGVEAGVVTPLPLESARWLLRRSGLPEALLVGAGDGPAAVAPDRAAFRAAVERFHVPARTAAFVGDLFWSDVHAAHRAGLIGVLLDRHDAWPKVQAGRMTTLDALEETLRTGGAPGEGIEPAGEPNAE
jgi:FMN phosphatase YigB (HAD superfamily)